MSHATSPPSIRIYDSASALHNRYHAAPPRRPSSTASSFASPSAIPMAIPNSREEPPPPLPPPRWINELNEGQDPGWQWGNSHTNSGPFGQVKPGSSLLGSFASSARNLSQQRRPEERPDPISASTDMNAEHGDKPKRPSLVDHSRLQSEKQLGQKSLENSSQAYDKQLLSKIGGPNTPTRTQAPGFLSSSAQETSTNSHFANPKSQLKMLSMPERLYTSLDSPASRWAPSGTISPGHTGYRSPILDSASSDSMSSRLFSSTSATEETASATRSHRGSYEQGIFMEHDFAMDENGIRDLNINDRSPGVEEYQLKGGLKRRASSPPSDAAREDRPTGASGNDLYHRRSQQMLGNRSSPVSRFHTNPSSLSSASSVGQRSYGSSFGLSMASSATSCYSERHSPGALSPATSAADTEHGPMSPFAGAPRAGVSHPSPRASLSRPPPPHPPHQHTHQHQHQHQHPHPHSHPHQHQHPPRPGDVDGPPIRKMSTDSLIHSRHSSVSKMPGLYICECCPKKPKKFESEEELRNHELEKQYTCAFCPNRFKNKNEAERHQNSLHLRRHSWSCAALEGPHAAFHASASHPGAADVCGYCGKEFANPPNWDERNDHLNHFHKFGECNQAKKFFRADHFRQHLKHSHAGLSGRWTNMLENACMKDEPVPSPSSRHSSRSAHMNSFDGNSTSSPGGMASAVINEVHDET